MQDDFESWMDVKVRESGDYWHDGKVAGVSHRNADGSCRQAIAATLETYDELEMRSEPDNKFDPNAVSLWTPAGEMVGYSESRLAAELTRDQARGRSSRCFVRAVREGRESRGVSIAIIRQSRPKRDTATDTRTTT